MTIKEGVSVIICCYNSSKKLPETIRHLSLQATSVNTPWEVVLINNNSTDDTALVASEEWNKYKLSVPFRIIDQPVPGLSAAREKGIENSNYDYLIFCDDDNYLTRNYVQKSYELMKEMPDVALLGGSAYGVFETGEIDEKLKPFLSALAIGPQNSSSGYVDKPLYGAGVTLRKSMYVELLQAGFKSLLSGRKGKELSSGEDTELGLAFLMLGKKIYYSEDLKLGHFMPENRVTEEYLYKLCTSGIPSVIIMLLYTSLYRSPGKKSFSKACLYAYKLFSKNVLYYSPRVLAGKNKFYSTFSLDQNIKAIVYLTRNIKRLKGFYDEIYSFSLNVQKYKGESPYSNSSLN